MKKLICLFVTILLGISTVRVLLGRDPSPMTSFLRALSSVDVRFDDLLFRVAELGNALKFPSLGGTGDFFTEVANFFGWFYNLLSALIEVPLAVVKDVFDFLSSIMEFFRVLLT